MIILDKCIMGCKLNKMNKLLSRSMTNGSKVCDVSSLTIIEITSVHDIERSQNITWKVHTKVIFHLDPSRSKDFIDTQRLQSDPEDV